MADRIPRAEVEAIVLDAVTTASRPVTVLDLEAELAAHNCLELTFKPTASQVLDAVRELLARGELADTFDPRQRGSKHYLVIRPETAQTAKGLFE